MIWDKPRIKAELKKLQPPPRRSRVRRARVRRRERGVRLASSCSLSERAPRAFRLSQVNLDWRPEPTPEEREALEQALARLLAEREDARGAWWRAGVGESLSPDTED